MIGIRKTPMEFYSGVKRLGAIQYSIGEWGFIPKEYGRGL